MDLTSCECSISTPMHSKSASGNTETNLSETPSKPLIWHILPTFPYPDRFVSTAARQKSSRSRVCDTFALRLVAFQRTDAFPCSFFLPVFIPDLLPDPNVRIERTRRQGVPRRRPSQSPNRLCVSRSDRSIQLELGFSSGRRVVA